MTGSARLSKFIMVVTNLLAMWTRIMYFEVEFIDQPMNLHVIVLHYWHALNCSMHHMLINFLVFCSTEDQDYRRFGWLSTPFLEAHIFFISAYFRHVFNACC